MTINHSGIEKYVFYPALIITALTGLGFIFSKEIMAANAKWLDEGIKGNLGWLFLLFGFGLLVFGLWLAFGRHGNVKLGEQNEGPEFSTPKWIAMMFTAGIGAGLVTWAFGEPLYYLADPPFGITGGSDEAYEWAHMYPLIHWGIVPWAFYAVAAVPIAFSLYVAGKPYLRISESCEHALPKTGRAISYRVIDVLIILGIIAGTTTSLGIGVPLLSALIAELTGQADTMTLKIAVLLVWVIIFGTSTIRGLKRGISFLADINMVLAIILMLIILVVGPTLFILNMTTNSLGLMLDNFFRTILWTDPLLASNDPEAASFPETWTVFYWAWWLAFAAFVGLFIARISRGRTIKQVVLGTIFWGSLGTMSYLAIAGGYALHLEKTGIMPLSEILNDPAYAGNELMVMTAKIAANLPFPKLSLIFFIVLCTIFYATTMDSAAYICAGICSREIKAKDDPDLSLRFAWISVLFLMTMGAVLTENMDTVMYFTVIGAVPLIPIVLLMCVSLVRQLNQRGLDSIREQPLG